MTRKVVVLDSGPLGLLAQSKAHSLASQCSEWFRSHLAAGNDIVTPEIADYGVRRELIRLNLTKGILKLDSLVTIVGVRYHPINTRTMRQAAQFWADARRAGRPTADPTALDADVILAAQAIDAAGDQQPFVATSNAKHPARFVAAIQWFDLEP
jgi:hypothetical protein